VALEEEGGQELEHLKMDDARKMLPLQIKIVSRRALERL